MQGSECRTVSAGISLTGHSTGTETCLYRTVLNTGQYRTIPAVPAKIGHSGRKLKFGRYKKKKKKNYINHLHCHPPVTNPAPITHYQLLLPPLLLHLCPSIKAATSSPCPSLNVLSSLYTFIILSASDGLINVNDV